MQQLEKLYQIFLQHPIICTDTRNISDNCLFFALKGDSFDANEFAAQAIDSGAAYAVVDNAAFAENDRFILVVDVLGTLQELAAHHRDQLSIPVIGLTGSNGKTTTKELIRAVLAERYKVFATKGNLNNHIGVPLSILNIGAEIEIAVIEMGANHQKEIEFLCSIAKPTHGLISNVGLAHLEGFGGFEGVKKGKAELYHYLGAKNGYIFLNAANLDLAGMAKAASLNHVIPYNIIKPNCVHGVLKSSDPFIELQWSLDNENYTAKANLTGNYNFENILAAISVGCFFKVKAEEINTGLANYFPTNNRSQVNKTPNNTVLCDFYNANPSSMTVAINNLASLSAAHKVAILGDMFELGDASFNQHQQIINLAAASKFDTLVFIGHHFYSAKANGQGHFFTSNTEAAKFISNQNWKNALILLKGSRGMALEELLPLL